MKVESVNRLSDQTKVDLFNTFIKSAFPEFDSLLMASWNVVSVYCCVGTEDMMLHNSIGELNEVLQKFEDQYIKSGKSRVSSGGAGEFSYWPLQHFLESAVFRLNHRCHSTVLCANYLFEIAPRKEIGSAQKPNGSTQEPSSVRLLETQPRKQQVDDQHGR